jgi:hypothetical protein
VAEVIAGEVTERILPYLLVFFSYVWQQTRNRTVASRTVPCGAVYFEDFVLSTMSSGHPPKKNQYFKNSTGIHTLKTSFMKTHAAITERILLLTNVAVQRLAALLLMRGILISKHLSSGQRGALHRCILHFKSEGGANMLEHSYQLHSRMLSRELLKCVYCIRGSLFHRV